jgi:DNA (cytosine-5)-methyltransferase 1
MGHKTIKAVDLFCGAGGLTAGLRQSGISVTLGIDIDPACEFPYEANNPGSRYLLDDVAAIKPELIKKAWKGADVKVLAGCAPCQPFSTYTQGKKHRPGGQWSLLKSFGNLINQSRPHIVTMENVGSLVRHKIFRQFCDVLLDCEYELVWDVLDCHHYGVPQARKRLVLIASLLGRPNLPRKSNSNHRSTVRDCIQSMPFLEAGKTHPDDRLHVCSRLTPLNMKRMKVSTPGGSWRDWPKNLIAPCHNKKTGKTYPAVYGRMEWDRPAPTITGQCYGFGNGRFGHPEQDRAISLREAALLQSFPADYVFVPEDKPVRFTEVGLMIGNAVPPKLAAAVGRAIVGHVSRFS